MRTIRTKLAVLAIALATVGAGTVAAPANVSATAAPAHKTCGGSHWHTNWWTFERSGSGYWATKTWWEQIPGYGYAYRGSIQCPYAW